MSQSASDQINKAVWMLFEGTKDTLMTNLTIASKRGQIAIDEASLQKLLLLAVSSIEEGFHKGHRTFTKLSEEALNEVENAAWTQGNLMVSKEAKPKKK